MKIYLLQIKFILMVVLFSSAVSAQVILNPDRKPAIGDSFITTYMDTTGVTEGPFGSNILWDFSNLTSTGEQWSVAYVDPAEAPNNALYPDADIAVSYDGLAHTFYDTDGNSVYSLGVAYVDFAMVYSNNEKVAEFPFILSSSFIDSFQATYQVGENLEGRNYGRIKMTGDAFGTIKLPDGSTRSALRVKIDRESCDTIVVMGIPVGINTFSSTTYQWYTNESKYPVLGISYINTQSNGMLSSYKQVDYNTETATDVNDEPGQIVNGFKLLQNFPNPFNPATVIKYSVPREQVVTLKVYNLLGSEVATLVNENKPAGDYEVRFNAEGLSSGLYFYKLEAGTYSETKKMLLVR